MAWIKTVAPDEASGFGDAAIHDIVQVTGLFDDYNHVADGLGVDPEP